MQIQISTRHGHLSEESQARITAKAEKLLKIFDRLTAIEVIVDLTDSASPPLCKPWYLEPPGGRRSSARGTICSGAGQGRG